MKKLLGLTTALTASAIALCPADMHRGADGHTKHPTLSPSDTGATSGGHAHADQRGKSDLAIDGGLGDMSVDTSTAAIGKDGSAIGDKKLV